MKKFAEVPDYIRAHILSLPESDKVESVEGFNQKSEDEKRERSIVLDHDKRTAWLIYGMPGSADEKEKKLTIFDFWHMCFRRDCKEPLIHTYGVMLCSNCFCPGGGLEFSPTDEQRKLYSEHKTFIPTGEQFIEAAKFKMMEFTKTMESGE